LKGTSISAGRSKIEELRERHPRYAYGSEGVNAKAGGLRIEVQRSSAETKRMDQFVPKLMTIKSIESLQALTA